MSCLQFKDLNGENHWPQDVQANARKLLDQVKEAPLQHKVKCMLIEFLGQFIEGTVQYYPLIIWARRKSCTFHDEDGLGFPYPTWPGHSSHNGFPYDHYARDGLEVVQKVLETVLHQNRRGAINVGETFQDRRSIKDKNLALIMAAGSGLPHQLLLGLGEHVPFGTQTVFQIPQIMPGARRVGELLRHYSGCGLLKNKF